MDFEPISHEYTKPSPPEYPRSSVLHGLISICAYRQLPRDQIRTPGNFHMLPRRLKPHPSHVPPVADRLWSLSAEFLPAFRLILTAIRFELACRRIRGTDQSNRLSIDSDNQSKPASHGIASANVSSVQPASILKPFLEEDRRRHIDPTWCCLA